MKNIKNKYAYVWLLMKGSKYLAGIITSIYSIIRTKTQHDIIVMITEDVDEKTRKILKKIAIVKEIPYIKTNIQLLTKRQKEKYDSWMNVSTTKWNCMNFTEYQKVLFLDADTIIIKNIDHLFKLRAPAGTFYNPWSLKTDGKIIKNFYKDKKQIYTSDISKALFNKGFVIIASCVLIKPDKLDFINFKNMLKEKLKFNTYSSADESSLVYYYSIYRPKKINWTNLSNCYQFIPAWYKYNSCTNGKPFTKNVYILHIFGDLPWEMTNKEMESYPDLPIWVTFFKKSLELFKIEIKDVYFKHHEILKYKYQTTDIFHKIIFHNNVNDYTLIILRGFPGSGKTYFSTFLNKKCDAKIISFDKLTLSKSYKLAKNYWEQKKLYINIVKKEINKKQNNIIVIDHLNYRKKDYDWIINEAFDYNIIILEWQNKTTSFSRKNHISHLKSKKLHKDCILCSYLSRKKNYISNNFLVNIIKNFEDDNDSIIIKAFSTNIQIFNIIKKKIRVFCDN